MSRTEAPPFGSRLRDPLLVAATAALAGALAEVALILAARTFLQRYTPLNPQAVWLAPLGNLVFILPVTLLIWGIGRWRGASWALPAATAVAVFMAAMEPLLVLYPRVHMFALLLLAAGVGVQAGRLLASYPRQARGSARWLAAAMAVIALAGGVWFNVSRRLAESRALAGLPDAPAGAPNVLLLVLDTVRALSLSVYGYERPTAPTLEALAARGVRFDRAVATAPWTLPTHASLFTGRYPHELSASHTVPLDDTYPTLAERLSAAGIATAGFSANLRYASYEFGVDRGFGYFRDYDVSLPEMLRSSALSRTLAFWIIQQRGGASIPGRLSAQRMNERFFSWLDGYRAREGERPFFAFINFYDAHTPYDPPAPYDTMFSGRKPPTRNSETREFTAEEVAGLVDSYDASIAYLDMKLGELFAGLERRGLLQNTVIIVTSDHGEEFNEHGHMNHGNTLYFPGLHVPLIVAGPAAAGTAVPQQVQVRTPVTLRDVPATVLELQGLHERLSLPGASLSRFWRPGGDSAETLDDAASPVYGEVDYTQNLPAHFPVSKGGMKSVVVRGHHFIRGADGAEELFNVLTDPFEMRNVLGDSSLTSLADRARALVEEARAKDVRTDLGPRAAVR